MSKLEFEGILRGIFEEDEKVLIGIGGVIGAVIGTLQAAIVRASVIVAAGTHGRDHVGPGWR